MATERTMHGEPRCQAMCPRQGSPDLGFPPSHYERCIRAQGHEGKHDDVYGRWWSEPASTGEETEA